MDERDCFANSRKEPIYSYARLLSEHREVIPESNILKSLKIKMKRSKVSAKSIAKNIVPFPFIMASFYSYRLLPYDVVAGLTMLMFHIPQGMAFGLMAGVLPINGLYASFIPPLVYFLFGTSRHLSIGTYAVMALLSGSVTMRQASSFNFTMIVNNSSGQIISADTQFEMNKVNITIAVTMMTGIFQFLLGLCRLGFAMNYISDSLLEGFTTAASFHIITSQLGQVLGYSVERYSGIGELPYKLLLLGTKFTSVNCVTLSISIICITILFLFSEFITPLFQNKFNFPLPIQFVLIVLATAISYVASFSTNFSVKIIGPIPKGLPVVLVPDLGIVPRIVLDSFILAIVGSVMDIGLAKILALRFSYKVNYNQELVAYGLSNFTGSFFQCIISAGAIARTSAVVQAGMKSQVASIISCVCMVFVLLFIGPLFEHIPTCVLSSIIIASLKELIMQFTNLPHLYRTSKYDFNVWILTFVTTLVLNVPLGLICGFLFSLLTIIIRSQNPKFEVIGKLPTTNIYKDINHFEDAQEIRGVKIVRFEASLYFANASLFQSKLYKKINIKSCMMNCMMKKELEKVDNSAENTSQSISDGNKESNIDYVSEDSKINIDVEPSDRIRFVIIDFSCINYIDSIAIRILNNILDTLEKCEISLLIAGPNKKVREMFEKSNFANERLNEMMFVTVHDAVLRCLEIISI